MTKERPPIFSKEEIKCNDLLYAYYLDLCKMANDEQAEEELKKLVSILIWFNSRQFAITMRTKVTPTRNMVGNADTSAEDIYREYSNLSTEQYPRFEDMSFLFSLIKQLVKEYNPNYSDSTPPFILYVSDWLIEKNRERYYKEKYKSLLDYNWIIDEFKEEYPHAKTLDYYRKEQMAVIRYILKLQKEKKESNYSKEEFKRILLNRNKTCPFNNRYTSEQLDVVLDYVYEDVSDKKKCYQLKEDDAVFFDSLSEDDESFQGKDSLTYSNDKREILFCLIKYYISNLDSAEKKIMMNHYDNTEIRIDGLSKCYYHEFFDNCYPETESKGFKELAKELSEEEGTEWSEKAVEARYTDLLIRLNCTVFSK